MEANRSRIRWTWAEFARLPSEGGTRYEVIADELAVTPAPSVRHQQVVMDLGTILNTFVRDHDLGWVIPGPVDVVFAEGDYLEPDLVFVHKDRLGLITDRGVEGAPDLVVEVLSPSSAARDRGLKLERYRHYGVAEYWIADPGQSTVEVWRPGPETGVENPSVLRPGETLAWCPGPGSETLRVDVGEIFSGVQGLPEAS